jgi:outer membrane protein OmpA-like peptidoglycan-associated protein
MSVVHVRPAVFAIACMLISGCARVSVEQPRQPGQDLAVLLPDSGNGAVGRAVVSNAAGAVDLTEARAATRVSRDRAPSLVAVLSEAEVQREFGDALASLPPAPETFALYFQFESEELAPTSRALLAETLQAVKQRPVPDVLVVGHTDTMGPPASNFQLALRRAQAVRTLLVDAGLDDSAVAVSSHGEAQPLVPTPDETNEPRNRRVVITVR